jgi:hypothetical protein
VCFLIATIIFFETSFVCDKRVSLFTNSVNYTSKNVYDAALPPDQEFYFLGATALSITALSISTLGMMTFSITTLSILTFSIMIFSIMILSIMIFSITILSIMTFSMVTLRKTIKMCHSA